MDRLLKAARSLGRCRGPALRHRSGSLADAPVAVRRAARALPPGPQRRPRHQRPRRRKTLSFRAAAARSSTPPRASAETPKEPFIWPRPRGAACPGCRPSPDPEALSARPPFQERHPTMSALDLRIRGGREVIGLVVFQADIGVK